MKNFIKKSAVTTLSVLGILSAMPSAFCSSVGGNNNSVPQNNERGHIDSFNITVVGKYLRNTEDLCNLSIVNKKYEDILERYHYSPVGITSIEQVALLPKTEVCCVGKCEGEFISTFPNDTVREMIYLPGSFTSSQYEKVLKDNKLYSAKWTRTFEFSNENPMNGCQVVFKNEDNGKSITFLFCPLTKGTLDNVKEYNELLADCGLNEEELAAATIKFSDKFSISNFATSIGNFAFHGCEGLTNVNIPSSVKIIGEYAFSNCNNLTNIKIPSSVDIIRDCAFNKCDNLITADISSYIIGKDAFNGCKNLTTVNISDSVIHIADWAFYNCYNLNKINIPTSVKSIGEGIFEGCVNLNKIEFNGNVYDNVDSFMQAFNAYRENHKQ